MFGLLCYPQSFFSSSSLFHAHLFILVSLLLFFFFTLYFSLSTFPPIKCLLFLFPYSFRSLICFLSFSVSHLDHSSCYSRPLNLSPILFFLRLLPSVASRL